MEQMLPQNKSFFQKAWQYTTVGVATYVLDILLIYVFKNYLGLSDAAAVGFGFFIAVTLNFLVSYYWVFRGTVRTKRAGYVYFCTLAIVGLLVIIPSTLYVRDFMQIDIYYARTIVATLVGIVAFLINVFFNFKMPH